MFTGRFGQDITLYTDHENQNYLTWYNLMFCSPENVSDVEKQSESDQAETKEKPRTEVRGLPLIGIGM